MAKTKYNIQIEADSSIFELAEAIGDMSKMVPDYMILELEPLRNKISDLMIKMLKVKS
jgi:hypothetical protein